MKSFRIVAVSLFFTILFSSCQKNYEKLIEGCWQVNVDKSYFIEKGKRSYFDDESGAPFYLIKFENGSFVTNNENNNTTTDPTSDKGHHDDYDLQVQELLNSFHIIDNGKYHIDKDSLFSKEGVAYIYKMNNSTMVLENTEVHIEFDRIDCNYFSAVLEGEIQLKPIEEKLRMWDSLANWQRQFKTDTLD